MGSMVNAPPSINNPPQPQKVITRCYRRALLSPDFLVLLDGLDVLMAL
jgi:hypothetical protein